MLGICQFVGSNTNREGLSGAWQVTNQTEEDVKFLFSEDNRVRVVINGAINEGTVEVADDQVTLHDPNGNSMEFRWERSGNGLTLTSMDGSQTYEMDRFQIEGSDEQSESDSTEESDEETDESSETQSIPTMGSLASILILEDDGTWCGRVHDGAYHLLNPESEDAIRYYFIDALPDDIGNRAVEVQAGAVEGAGMAGLLYGFQEDPKRYYMLVVDGEGTIRLFHRAPDGMSQKFSATLGEEQKPKAGEPVKMRMVEDGKSVEIFVNGKSLGSFEGDGTGKGAVGIVAIGIVDAMFKNFEVNLK